MRRAGVLLTLLAAGACQAPDDGEGGAAQAPPPAPDGPLWTELQNPEDRVYAVEGLSGPEAVKYDPEQDVYFISNFGDGEGPNDGFVSRVAAGDGSVEALRWAVGTDAMPLGDPLGMALQGDTLWVVDADGLHAFHRRTGEAVGFVDMTALAPGFLNDVALGADGALYVTDTGASRVYRVAAGEVTLAAEGEVLGSPNGITWDAGGQRFLLVPWEGGDSLRAWNPASGELGIAARSPGGRFDGVEPIQGGFLLASQADSAVHVVVGPQGRPLIRVPGRPADLAVDSRRGRVAVPYIALNRVDVFQLPAGAPGAAGG